MGQRFIVSALCAILAVFMVTPAMAQDAYPPDESPEVIDRDDERDEDEDDGSEVIDRNEEQDEDDGSEVLDRNEERPEGEEEPEAETEVRGVALEQEESTLPVTGATIGVLAAVGLGVLVFGGVLLKTSRRRVDVK